MRSFRNFERVLFVLPVVCLTATALYAGIQAHRAQRLEASRRSVEAKIRALESEIAAYRALPAPTRVVSASPSPNEQAAFLRELRAGARRSGALITRWLVKKSAGAAQEIPQGQPAPIATELGVRGDFASVRRMLYALQRSPRLLNMTDAWWRRSEWPVTEAGLTLTRYVDAAPDGSGERK
jgi:hypothetical protein